jgi:subtilase family serine protease
MAAARITDRVSDEDRVVLEGNVNPQAKAELDRGAAAPSLPMERMLLVLKRSPEQEAALKKYLAEQKNSGSPNYRHWLTPREFGIRFGASIEDVLTIQRWLTSHGFHIDEITHGHQVIMFSGNAGQVEAAFHTPIHRFEVDGKERWANTKEPEIPRALAPVVVGVASLHNFEKKPQNHFVGAFHRDETTHKLAPVPSPDGKTPKPAFTFDSGFWLAVGPADFATIYNLPSPLNINYGGPTLDGTGITIGITQRSNINLSDISQFQSQFALPVHAPTVLTPFGDPGVGADESEALIDVEWSGAAAPGATIKMVASASTLTTDGVDLSAQYLVDTVVPHVMSTSYGLCELFLGTAENAFLSSLWQQAAAEGITSFVSTGDNGSAGCDAAGSLYANYGLQVNGLASTPYNVAVGGTDFLGNIAPDLFWDTNDSTSPPWESAFGYVPEMPWNSSCADPLFGLFGFSTSPVANCNNPDLLFSGWEQVVGGSGGKSNCAVSRGSFAPGSCVSGYPKPSWQVATGLPAGTTRMIPDVSLFASNGFLGSFYVVCEADAQGGPCDAATLTFAGFGGTSVSSPAFAGIMALVVQSTGSAQGNANYDLYKLAATQPLAACKSSLSSIPSSSCIFRDTAYGSIAMPCMTPGPNCTGTGSQGLGVLSGYTTNPGWDRATGLGSVNVVNLISHWPTATAAFTSPTYTAKETLASAPITVNRVGPTTTPVYVTWAVEDPTVCSLTGIPGSAGVDFKSVSGNFTIATGATTGSFMFPLMHDTAMGDHQVCLGLFPAPGGTPSLAILTLQNVDNPGSNIQFSVSSANATTSPSGPLTHTLTVTRTGTALASGVEVDYAAANGTASSGTDYTLAAGTLVFGAGQVSKTISYTVTRNGTTNLNFSVTLSNPRNANGAIPAPTLGSRTTETITIIE